MKPSRMKIVRKHPPARLVLPCMRRPMAEHSGWRQSRRREVHLLQQGAKSRVGSERIEEGIDLHGRQPGILDFERPVKSRERAFLVPQLGVDFAELGACRVAVPLPKLAKLLL